MNNINDIDDLNLTAAEYYMQECFELAKGGLGFTSPNPVVGAIVLDKNGMPVGKGYHKKAGTEHAEVLAIKEAGKLASGGTLIVNLEPCCHHGRTPPCTDLIIKSSIKEVIFSNYDPNPLINKKSEKILLENNIKVLKNVLEKEGFELNRFFFKWIKSKLPWITLKQAQTLDGKVALSAGHSKWITGEDSRREVHKLRNIYDAVLIGASTVKNDDPQLTVRGIENSRNPARVILDPDLITDPRSKVYEDSALVILATKVEHIKEKLNKYLAVNEKITILQLESFDSKLNLNQLFLELGKKEIVSVFVEAGPTLASELVLNNLVDEYILFISPQIFGDVKAIPTFKMNDLQSIDKSYKLKIFNHKVIGNDLMLLLRPEI